jgi:hypothetical protein
MGRMYALVDGTVIDRYQPKPPPVNSKTQALCLKSTSMTAKAIVVKQALTWTTVS